MKKPLTASLIALLLVSMTGSAPAQQRPIDQLKFPPLTFATPRAEQLQLPNGMTLFILEDHEIPVVDMFAAIHTGSAYEAPEKTGLAGLTASVMRSGGTVSRPPEQINEDLEHVAASVETGMDVNVGTASMSVLTGNLDRALPIFADVLMHPAFRQEQLDVAKALELDGIKRQNDTPEQIADRIFPQLIYGKTSPFARSETEQSISGIKREDLVGFHARYYHPNNMILGISGDVSKDAIVKRIEHEFAGWQPQKTDYPALPQPVARDTTSLYHVPQDINQTTIRIGFLGLKQGDPDYFSVVVATQILGGGFSSRLFNELRTAQGLAYVAAAGHSADLGHIGYFIAIAETRADSSVKAVDTIRRVMRGMREAPVGEAELSDARQGILNSFVFAYDAPSKIVRRQVVLAYFGLSQDFMQQYRDEVSKVTADDVLRIAKKYFKPDASVILVVGNEKAFDKPLSTVAPATTIDLGAWDSGSQ